MAVRFLISFLCPSGRPLLSSSAFCQVSWLKSPAPQIAGGLNLASGSGHQESMKLSANWIENRSGPVLGECHESCCWTCRKCCVKTENSNPAVSGERPQVELHGSKPLEENGNGSPPNFNRLSCNSSILPVTSLYQSLFTAPLPLDTP